jgi:putative transposase
MPNYRRAVQPGGTFFFTVVTADRAPILLGDAARTILHNAMTECGRRWDFRFDAGVVLNDHLHTVWTLPPGDTDFSRRWAWIKRRFSSEYLAVGGSEKSVTADHARQRRRGIWQPRFYEHLIRDQDDFNRHLDYIHYNPVKHGLARCPHAWPWSSFHRWVREKGYEADWGCACGGRKPASVNWDWVDDSAME